MPDWVNTEMIVQGDASEVQKFIENAARPVPVPVKGKPGEHETSDTHVPLSFWNEIAPTDLEAYFKDDDGRRDWNIENWGTKWDARNVYVEKEDGLGEVVYRFDTAYDAPIGYFAAVVRNWPELFFQFGWDDDEGSAELDGDNGELGEIEYPDREEEEEEQDW